MDVTLEKDKLMINFEKMDKNEFAELQYDISEIYSEEELIEKINLINLDENKYYKIILIGNKNIEININKILKNIYKKNILKINDLSKLKIDFDKIKKENNIKSYFLQEIDNIKNKNIYSEEEIEKAIEIVLQLL